ncbi:ATP12 family chaperone protein [Aureimonas mangrovi]|uniref:ATP12 family chaperone protein n=1 Tax=Aureimonas mangrovi TaxID=2758041 RepID=UPI00163DBB04|nr:ATP12 family protein [Aureimonas mangrovi]
MIENTSLPKRFYKTVSVQPEGEAHAVLLDGRPLKTPGRRSLTLPSAAAAEAVAEEWRGQGERIDPATMPVTRLANTIVDAIADDPSAVREDLKRYAETDLLFYRADGPERLVERQSREWDPVLRWAEERVGALFLTGAGVMHIAQPPESVAAVAALLEARTSGFEIAALHQMTTLTGSLILSLAVIEARLDDVEAWRLAHLDEDWNIEQWGEDAEASARRAARFADMRAAALIAARAR